MWADGFIQVGLFTKIHIFFSQHVCTIYAASKFKLEVGTSCTNQYACSMICDPCKPTYSKGYKWVLPYVGTGHLIHYIHGL